MKIPKIKEYSQKPFMQHLKEFDYKLFYEYLLTKQKEIEKQQPCTDQKPPHADPLQLTFIHNARAWQLLKESHKYGVFIDKILIILSHEFLLYEREIIEISLDKLLNYFDINISKSSIDYIRRKLKSIRDFLVKKDFITNMTIKNSMLICEISTLFIKEMKEKRIITKIDKIAFSLSSDKYRIKRIKSFFENNLKIRQNDLNIESLIAYFKDSNKNRKKNEIIKLLDIL